MKKKWMMAVAMLTLVFQLHAQEFSTLGDGKVYSFQALSAIDGSGVTLSNGDYVVNGKVVIANGDEFVMDGGATVLFADDAELVIKGKADLRVSQPTVLNRLGEASTCLGLNVESEEVVEVSHLTFEYVGLRGGVKAGMNVSDCTFLHHNGMVTSALFLGGDGASFRVSNCRFEYCQKAAIGGAANYFCPLLVENCVFKCNSQANGNVPQLNLTASETIAINHCVVEGDSLLTMVGGIGIANGYGLDGFKVSIEGCEITNNRYGVTTMGVMDVVIKDNILCNNKFEVNPNNGGSGISLYDPYYKQKAVITGNTIEKNLWGVTVIGCGDVNLGKTEVGSDATDYNPGGNVFIDNGNNGIPYDLYNNSVNTVYAQGNVWSVPVQDAESIETVIHHKTDDPSLGEVVFLPAGATRVITAKMPDVSAPAVMYDLQGIRIDPRQGLPKGIYIVNGKKVAVP